MAKQQALTTGPPAVFEAIPDIDWQRNGWQYRPKNKAAVAIRSRRLAELMAEHARDMAAVGMGEGVWPEHSAELLEASKLLLEWADVMEVEAAAQPTGTENDA